MASVMKEPKFPLFMSLLYSKGIDVKEFAEYLVNLGYGEYNYSNVRKKLRGDAALNFEDIIVFSEAMKTEPAIFFES